MDVIRNRVITNGSKTDGFLGLLLKAYLILDTIDKKEYSPLYIWKTHEGMNKFIFEGYYDNILKSFGWQNINIAVPLEVNIKNNILSSKYVLEIQNIIKETNTIPSPKALLPNIINTSIIRVYNPNKWKYIEFYFFNEFPSELKDLGMIYEILHISM